MARNRHKTKNHPKPQKFYPPTSLGGRIDVDTFSKLFNNKSNQNDNTQNDKKGVQGKGKKE